MSWCVVCALIVVAFTSGVASAGDEAAKGGTTVIELSKPKPAPGFLGTVGDAATEAEKPFRQKVNEPAVNHWAGLEVPPAEGEKVDPKQKAEDDKRRAAEGKVAKAYTLVGQAGRYVGWYGIVRKATYDKASGRTTLLVQHCYSDGLSDAHIQVVSIYGAGDFRAVVVGEAREVPALALVRAYGTVAAGKDGVAEVSAEYVRVWDWGLFTFMNYGADRTNKAWTDLRRIKGDDIYTPRPDTKYYEAVLGKRETGK
jgi:hypothetical protein